MDEITFLRWRFLMKLEDEKFVLSLNAEQLHWLVFLTLTNFFNENHLEKNQILKKLTEALKKLDVRGHNSSPREPSSIYKQEV